MRATEHLLVLLKNQKDILTRLQRLCREERACLLNSQLDRLEEVTQEQNSLLTSQGHLSVRISRTLGRLGTALHLTGTITLSNIIDALDSSDAEIIREYYHALTALSEEVQREGRVNWYLSQQALKYVDYTLKLVGRAKDGPRPYGPGIRQGQHRSLQLLMDSCA